MLGTHDPYKKHIASPERRNEAEAKDLSPMALEKAGQALQLRMVTAEDSLVQHGSLVFSYP